MEQVALRDNRIKFVCNPLIWSRATLIFTGGDAPRLSEVKLNHRGERCTFEAIIEDYNLNESGLTALALIVRAADIKGQEHIAPEGVGLRAIADGCQALGLSDEDRLAKQFPIYDALLAYCRKSTNKEITP